MTRSRFIALSLVFLVLAGLGAGTWLATRTGEVVLSAAPFSAGVAFFTFVGAFIVWHQPGNRVGWAFAAMGALWITGDAAARYAAYVYKSGHGDPALIRLGAWYGEWYWFAFLMLAFSILPQIFPTGRPLPGRWRKAFVAVCSFVGVMVLLAMLEDELDVVYQGRTVPNPVGIPGLHDIEQGAIAGFALGGALICILLGMLAAVVRFRRSRGVERQQLKWFTFAALVLIVQFVGQSLIETMGVGDRLPLLDAVALGLVPLSAAGAMFRYRLYDIDLVINRALVYGALTAVLAGAYLGLVVLFQRVLSPLTADSDVAIAGSTLAVAALFRPLRGRVQEFIDRRFYRHRYDASETLEEFATSLRDEVDLDSLSRELVEVVAETMQPAHASLWLRPGETS